MESTVHFNLLSEPETLIDISASLSFASSLVSLFSPFASDVLGLMLTHLWPCSTPGSQTVISALGWFAFSFAGIGGAAK